MSSLLQQNCLFTAAHQFNDEAERVLALFPQSSDLAIYEDENSVTIEAAMPGIQAPEQGSQTPEAEVTFQDGILLIRGTKREEADEKNRHYLRKANRSYLYQLEVPGEIDEREAVRAELRHGVMKVVFRKKKKEDPRRIFIQS